MQNTTHTKLLAVRDKRKRWQTRLTRASNMLAKLAKQEARLLKEPTTPLPELDKFFQPEPKPVEDIAALDVPDYLKRTSVPVISTDDPDIVEKVAAALADAKVKKIKETKGPVPASPALTAAVQFKRQGSDEERKKMPLSGREALAAIKAKSAEVTARRAKRKLTR